MVMVITGGSGFLGSAIISEFLLYSEASSITEIRILDIRKPTTDLGDRVTFIDGDVRDPDIVLYACKGADIVVHSAAIVDWGTRTPNEVLEINVGGTENVIKACRETGVKFLIYTSSLDAIFSGKPLRHIDETQPYPALPVNAYCESKQQSEMRVQEANSAELKTCILRPADIFGENDPYHIGSLIDMAKKGFYVRLGDGKSVCQHVYVKNMAYAHVLVADAFLQGNKQVDGNVYLITDGPGKNFFKFYDQVVLGAGYSIWPKNLWLPRWVAYGIATTVEFAAWLIRPIKRVNPKFSRFAVVYTCSDFTFSAEKARKDFNYSPKYSEEEALNNTIAYYRRQCEQNHQTH